MRHLKTPAALCALALAGVFGAGCHKGPSPTNGVEHTAPPGGGGVNNAQFGSSSASGQGAPQSPSAAPTGSPGDTSGENRTSGATASSAGAASAGG